MTEYRLGRSITQIIPFHKEPIQQPKPKKERELITTKLVIIMVVVAIVKIAVLMLWI